MSAKLAVLNSNLLPVLSNISSSARQHGLTVPIGLAGNTTLAGIPREANIPASNNRDWQLVTNIPVSSANGTQASGLIQEGLFSVYDLDLQVKFKVENHYTIPERKSYAKLGDEVQFTQEGNLYRLSVASKGAGTQTNAGSIHFVKNGATTINGAIESYNWQLDIDPNYRGTFSSSVFYKQGEIVEYEDRLYKALRNIASGSAFVTPDWELVTDGTAHVGFIPTLGTNRIIVDDEVDGILVNPEEINVYGDIFWSTNTKVPV